MMMSNNLKEIAFDKLDEATKAMYEYACSLDIGEERIKAFEIYNNIRIAPVAESFNPFLNSIVSHGDLDDWDDEEDD